MIPTARAILFGKFNVKLACQYFMPVPNIERSKRCRVTREQIRNVFLKIVPHKSTGSIRGLRALLHSARECTWKRVLYVDNFTQMSKCFLTDLFVLHFEHPFDVANSLLHESWRSVVQRYAIRESVFWLMRWDWLQSSED